MSGILIGVALAVYVVVGLFISRWWWRQDVAPYDTAARVMAFWIVVLWPLYLVCVPIYAALRAFYGQPIDSDRESGR